VTTPTRQLALDLPHQPSFAREDFLLAPGNAEALRVIGAWPNWPSPTLLLIGPSGSGKSHLGAIWAKAAGARILRGEELASAAIPDLAAAPALLIDDADKIGRAEAELFHLLNLIGESGASALLTAARAPDLWGLATADLISRLRLAPVITLGEPDLELMRAALIKLFSDRQISVDPSVIAFLQLRLDRSLAAARDIVAALDHEALARGKAVSRAMAAEILRLVDNE
jgi:chromosomal replication initiation ATPase DnaA